MLLLNAEVGEEDDQASAATLLSIKTQSPLVEESGELIPSLGYGRGPSPGCCAVLTGYGKGLGTITFPSDSPPYELLY